MWHDQYQVIDDVYAILHQFHGTNQGMVLNRNCQHLMLHDDNHENWDDDHIVMYMVIDIHYDDTIIIIHVHTTNHVNQVKGQLYENTCTIPGSKKWQWSTKDNR
jgi:hypothetical protein